MPMQPPNYDFVLMRSPLSSLPLSSSLDTCITTSTTKQYLHDNTNAAPLLDVAVEMTTSTADIMMLKSNTTNDILRNSRSSSSSSSSDRIIASSLVTPLTPVMTPKQKKTKKCNSKKMVATRGKATLHKPSSLSVLLRHQQQRRQQQQQQQRMKQSHSKMKSVHFSKAPDQTRLLPPERSPLTLDTKQQLWYQSRDYVAMEHDSLSNLVALHQVNGDLSQLHPEDYCVRGLEMKTCPHIQRLRRLRAAIAVRAVLEAQHYYLQSQQQQSQKQHHSTLTKEESLASVSRCYSEQAGNRARELGLIDSIESQRASSSSYYHYHG